MPNVSSYADIVRDWERLLTAAQENAPDLAEAEKHRAALAEHLAATKALKDRQDTAIAVKQETTRELKERLATGRELAIRLRGAVKAAIGPRSELLNRFGVAPLRKRRKTERSFESQPPASPGPVLPLQPGGKPELVN